MSEDIAKPFLDAVTGLLAAAMPGVDVYTSGVTTPDDELTYPYLVLWPIPTAKTIANFAGNLIPSDNRIQMVGVGRDPDEVISVLDRAGSALVGARPTVDGWRCNRIREVSIEQPVTENHDILFNGRSTYRSWARFRMGAEPAPVTGS